MLRSRVSAGGLGWALVALAAMSGCAAGVERTTLEATLSSVDPGCASNASATPIAVHGVLPVKPDVSLASASESTIDASYRAWVGETELSAVTWVDSSTLTATVPPGIAAGAYALTVETPFRARFTLDGFRIAAGSCDATPGMPGAASLVADATAAPLQVAPGGIVIVTIVVRNVGETAAAGVTASVSAPAGFAPLTSDTDASDVGAGRSRTFTFTFTAQSGSGSFTVSAAGLDASTRQPVAAGVWTNAVAVAPPGSIHTYAVGGTIAGLAGSGLTLVNAGEQLSVPAGATSFSFVSPLAPGTAYTVTVSAQPFDPLQTCTTANGTGVIAEANVTDVMVTCVTRTFRVGGTVSGLGDGKVGLELRDGSGAASSLTVGQNGAFTFGAAVPSGASYVVSVRAQPKGQTCRVGNGAGTVVDADVTDIAVTCARSR